MRLASVKRGDIVRVDGSLAYVVETSRGRLVIRWAGRDSTVRSISARAVEAGWRRIANGKRAPDDRETS